MNVCLLFSLGLKQVMQSIISALVFLIMGMAAIYGASIPWLLSILSKDPPRTEIVKLALRLWGGFSFVIALVCFVSALLGK